MEKQKLVLIGNGISGKVLEILQNAPDSFEITILGSEPHLTYNRIQLSEVFAG